jgi:hypothetical protein
VTQDLNEDVKRATMADPTEMRVKEQRRAEALRANLKRRKAQARARDAHSEADVIELVPVSPKTDQQSGT